MTIPAPKLDDLTWADLMAAIRRRVPAESDGVWTLHAPVDPGITLLELFAYLLEQRLYWLDQVPDELVVAILRLLGLPLPQPARPAATVLALTSAEPVPVRVPAGTALARDPAAAIRFTLDDDVTAFPLDGEVTVLTDRDRTADLRAGRGVPLLATDGSPAAVRFTLPLAGSHAAPDAVSLLFELDSPVPPSWSPLAVADVDVPAELTWSWFRPGGDEHGEFAEVSDGTAGLRRSGVVRLRPPDGWSTQDRGLLVSTRAATYAAPPRLLRLAVNVSAARQVEHRTATGDKVSTQIADWLRLPGQRLTLPDAAGRLLDATLWLATDRWSSTVDFTFGSSRDRVFLVDRGDGALVFGDGLTARIPHPSEQACVDYTIGGGREGNGGLTTNWLPVTSTLPVRGANPVRAADGTDPETPAQARDRAAGALREVSRAVTAEDHVTLAVTTPGVSIGRAYAALGEHPGFPCARVPGAVTVHVVPAVPRADFDAPDFVHAPVPDPGTLHEVCDRLDKARLLTAEVFVRAPAYRDVRIRVDLAGNPADRPRVSAVVGAALRRFLDPLVGGVDETGWPFGEPLRPSALLRAAQRALGDLAEVVAVAIGLDGNAPGESCLDTPLRPGELPVAREVRTRVVPAVETGEGLS
ncbi:putative baseplate assembly protein [Actinokineospora auranticolor]|uniref:Putative phage baseplate assembly protein n=1 Tax=Actinokineospora auranticolor TaxID=155976 RepID=A0A2S6GPM6_9PSEU|nr:putative baseplate assembly protein [Actinokineospora auranticolor]PPK67147.1 putative phage baseplate assembly protein [Actinokineospora auranticolor]